MIYNYKVFGGVKGLLMNKNALHRFSLVAPIIDSIYQSFSEINNLVKETKDKHYQLTEATDFWTISNAEKPHSYFESLHVRFANFKCVYNIVSNAVVSENIAAVIMALEKIGTQMCPDFKSDRIQGQKSIWESRKKWKVLTFKSSGITEKVKSLNFQIVRYNWKSENS